MRKLSLALAAGSLAACAAPAWDGEVVVHGSLQEALQSGQGEGRFALDSIKSQHAVGIGVLENLAGEIVVYEGEVWTARALSEGRVEVMRVARPNEHAAFLALSEVPEWRAFASLNELTLATLEEALAALLEQAGIESSSGTPFAIEGELAELEAHVIAGACPQSGNPGPEPVRRRWQRVPARLVGFFSRQSSDALTPHGTRAHVHVVVAGAQPFVGHVDAVTIPARTRILVPGSVD